MVIAGPQRVGRCRGGGAQLGAVPSHTTVPRRSTGSCRRRPRPRQSGGCSAAPPSPRPTAAGRARPISRTPAGSRPADGSSSSSSRARAERSGDAQALLHPRRVATESIAAAAARPTRSSASRCGPVVGLAVELGHQLEIGPPRQIGIKARVLDEAGHATNGAPPGRTKDCSNSLTSPASAGHETEEDP